MTNLREKLARAIFDAHQATPRDRSELDAADAVLSTLTAEGMVIVPREPTVEMIAEGFEAIRMEEKWPELLGRVYEAMITALEGNRE